MVNDILTAFMDVAKSQKKLQTKQTGSNKMNLMGDPLEDYIRLAFSAALSDDSITRKTKLSSCLSYKGSASKPPDAIVRNGVAIEVKKVESRLADLQLNSSYPKKYLSSKDSRISKKAIDYKTNNETKWEQKDLVYVVGLVDKKNRKNLKELAFIDASIYCASSNTYELQLGAISKVLKEHFNVSKSNELGRINKVDPLEYSSLRIRGMWLLKSPFKMISNYEEYQHNDGIFSMFAIVSAEHFDAYDNKEKFITFAEEPNNRIQIFDIRVDDPDGTKEKIPCKLIVYSDDEHSVTESDGQTELQIR